MASTEELIVAAVGRVQGEAPALAKLKLVVGARADLGRAHRARQVRRPTGSRSRARRSTAGEPEDARLQLTIPKTMFERARRRGRPRRLARGAYYYGHLKVGGDPRVKRLLGQAIEPAL